MSFALKDSRCHSRVRRGTWFAGAVLLATVVALVAVPAAFAWDFPNQQIADTALSHAVGTWGGQCKNFAIGMVVDPVLAANGHPTLQGHGAPGCYYYAPTRTAAACSWI